MKLIFLIIMLTTMLFSSQKQIIVGSFVQEKYALNSVVRLNNYILNDDKLLALINKNSIEVELKRIGKYYAISLSPIYSYVELLRTLKALEKYYDDAYVLDNGQKVEMAEVVTKKIVEEKSPPPEVKVKKPKQVQPKKEEVKQEKAIEVKTNKQIEKVPYKEEKNYIFEIVLVLAVLLMIGYIVFKTTNRRKKDEKKNQEISQEATQED
jgi:hypothetical protein